jgi:hypothetical protein
MSTNDPAEELDRIRTTRERENQSDIVPDVYQCPIEGCKRIVIDNPGDLRNHVTQASDDAHKYKTLNEDLELETLWAEMDWGFGTPAFDSPPSRRERKSIYDPNDPWGPGLPKKDI